MGVPGKRCQGRGERATIPISYSDSPPLLPILILTLIFTFTRHLSPLTPQLSPITSHVSRLTSQRAMGEKEVDGEDEGEGECVSSKVYKQLLAQAFTTSEQFFPPGSVPSTPPWTPNLYNTLLNKALASVAGCLNW